MSTKLHNNIFLVYTIVTDIDIMYKTKKLGQSRKATTQNNPISFSFDYIHYFISCRNFATDSQKKHRPMSRRPQNKISLQGRASDICLNPQKIFKKTSLSSTRNSNEHWTGSSGYSRGLKGDSRPRHGSRELVMRLATWVSPCPGLLFSF